MILAQKTDVNIQDHCCPGSVVRAAWPVVTPHRCGWGRPVTCSCPLRAPLLPSGPVPGVVRVSGLEGSVSVDLGLLLLALGLVVG